ncbi:Uncharacterised protein [Mycobacteroides abscessus subsp. abscessus]|nr:Uncharacterised protein [Mycobacteroides abscessus subsp. abscessus]
MAHAHRAHRHCLVAHHRVGPSHQALPNILAAVQMPTVRGGVELLAVSGCLHQRRVVPRVVGLHECRRPVIAGDQQPDFLAGGVAERTDHFGDAPARRPALGLPQQRARYRLVVLAFEEPEERALAVALHIGRVDRGGDTSDRATATVGNEVFDLHLPVQGVVLGVHLRLHDTAQGRPPPGIVAVDMPWHRDELLGIPVRFDATHRYRRAPLSLPGR